MKSIFQYLLFLLIGFNVNAQTTQIDSPLEKSTLWKLEGKKIKKDVYLFGTMHLVEKAYYHFPEELSEIVKSSEQIVLEIGDLNPALGMQYLTLKEGSFFDYFSPEQIDTIIIYAEENLGMSEARFKMFITKLKPLIMVQLAQTKNLSGPTESYELNLMRMAKEANIPVLGFETIEQQLAIFDKLDSTQTAEMVMESIRDNPNGQTEFKTILELYRAQDIEKLYDLINQNEGVFTELGMDIIDNRNTNWVQQIEQITRKKKTFIAVGAGHLGGPNGLIRQLRREGYTLTPVLL